MSLHQLAIRARPIFTLRDRVAALIGATILVYLSISTVAAYEKAPMITLSEVLEPGLAQSVYHRVEDASLEGRYYRFQVDSQFGQYDILSLGMLRVRVHEFKILGEAVSQFSQREQQLSEALRGQLQVRADSAVDILTHPLATASELASQLTGQGQKLRTDSSNVITGLWLDVDDRALDPTLTLHRRNVAHQWGLDVYSSNPKVQQFLYTVARARAAGRPSAGAPYVGSHLGTPLTISDPAIENTIMQLVRKQGPVDLEQHNDGILAAMNIHADSRQAFLQHAAFSPRHQTRIVHYLHALDGVINRADFIESALSVQNEFVALAFEEATVMLVHYHHKIAPLKLIHAGKKLLHAVTADGRIVAFLPVDLITWSAETERLFNDLRNQAKTAGYSGWELVIAGRLTNPGRSQLTQWQFTVRENFVR